MPTIQFRSDNAEFMQALPERLAEDLQRTGLAPDLLISNPVTETSENTRGDPVTWTMIVLAAAGTGGKDGFLSTLARVLEKYVEGRKVEVLIETDGKKIQLSGPIGEIKAILQQIDKD